MTVRSKELDVNGIPKLIRNASGVSKDTNESANGSVTGMGLYNTVNAIVDVIMLPGKLFETNVFFGIGFMAVIGVILAVAAIGLGVPATHVQAPPSMIFGFASR